MNVIERECLNSCWKAIRAEGKRHFIVHYGLRRFALPTGIVLWLSLFVAVPVLLVANEPNLGYIGSRPFWLSLAATVLLWPVAGYLWAVLEWRRHEARYNESGLQDG